MSASIKKIIPLLIAISFILLLSLITFSNEVLAQTNEQVITECRDNQNHPIGSQEYVDCANSLREQSLGSYSPERTTDSPSFWDTIKCNLNPFDCALRNLVAMLSTIVLQLASLVTAMGGYFLNGSIYHTVVNVSQNYEKLPAIEQSWKVIRDVANMVFIFVLLYAAIQTIIGQGKDTKRLIVSIVMVGVLMNFSLFFTRFVIDVSNLMALTFYDALVPGAAAEGFKDVSISFERTIPEIGAGLSAVFMKSLNLQSLYSQPGATISFGKIIVTGVMGSTMLLIASFVFFAVALLFIIRYVVLMLVLIFSPIAFIAFILPDAKKYQGQWMDALIGQAFFAPIYMIVTYIAVKIMAGINEVNLFQSGGNIANVADAGWTGTFINYVVVIILLVASLMIAKEWANKAPGGVKNLTSWAMGAAGGATTGLVGRFGRNTLGSRATAIANDENLKRRAAEGSMSAKLQLATASRASKASFDLRGSRIGGNLDGGKAPKGGFVEDQKARTKAYAAYKPNDGAKKAAAEEAKKAKEELDKARLRAAERVTEEIPASSSLSDAENELKEARAASESEIIGLSPEDRAAQEATIKEKIKAAERKVVEEKEKRDAQINSIAEERTAAENEVYKKAAAKDRELATRMEEMAKKLENSRYIPGIMPSGKDKAKAIRAAGKEKSVKERFAESAADLAKEEAAAKGEPEQPKEEAGKDDKKE
jgi:hypothetical protein